MKTVQALARMDDCDVARLEAKRIDENYIDIWVSGEAVTVLKPGGKPLLVYKPDVLSPSLCDAAFDVFRRVKVGSQNRGAAAGELDADLVEVDGRPVVKRSATRFNRIKKDGTVSRTAEAIKAPSGIVGFMDRDARTSYCRQTAESLKNPARFRRARPFIKAVDRVFAETLPERYAAQKAAIDRTHPDFKIRDTAFTTVTVNKNWQTAVHQDDGDFARGFGVMSVLDVGDYDGGYLVFPKYRVGVDMRRGGVCLADVHEFHGNTPILGDKQGYVRLSLVFYMRERMAECGSALEESLRAREVTR